MIAFLTVVNGILDLRPVQYALVLSAIGLLIWAAILRAQVGVLSLQKDAALGREAQLHAAMQLQNQSVLQANEQAKYRAAKLREAEDKAKQLQIERDKWKKEALGKPLSGTCDEMVDQALESLK